MDGNGRWAKARGKKRTAGHKEGSNNLKEICKASYELGVEYVTVYAFSTENWQRPADEVSYLMDLLRQYLKESIKTSKKDNMRVRVIGDIDSLPQDVKDNVIALENASRQNTGLNLQIALNYGGRNEIIRGIQELVKDVELGNLKSTQINEKLFEQYLDTKDIPDPDFMIRTSGELRLSNFLLWQLAYTEFYFPNKYWPDFNKADLIQAIEVYNQKERRFGGLGNEN